MSERDEEVEQEVEEDLDDEESSVGALDEDEVIDDLDDETREDLRAVDEALSQKDQNARALAIRRAIEQRMEDKKLNTDLDYLDLDD